jgi:hypothetical protein
MGNVIPITKPIEYGNDCSLCFAAGKTPKYVTATFSGITLCPGMSWPEGWDLNISYLLTQSTSIYLPCFWSWSNGYTVVSLSRVDSPYAALDISTGGFVAWFLEREYSDYCKNVWYNELDCVPSGTAQGGTGIISL